ncbi:hypothetical protein SAMD00023353_4000850 [Rosellinia necatrix]|uniref:Nucleoside 2-deoxyribosyltransferase domain-containing protein n=1 Tax=Rosellinia necatrix TaxID=77044 RepID=A0A1W2TM86_ROSNE|nr:hypothetical protein SAMD00023353_4000850 [Rosellinia necatrix]
MSVHNQCQTIKAPSREPPRHGAKKIFLAGSTSARDEPDWRERLIESLADQPLTIYNPLRLDWDATWHEDISDARYREQVEWELEMQELADVVVVYFHPATQAPVSLLELGLCARGGRAIVACPRGYWKRGNVEILCLRYGIEMVEDVRAVGDAIVKKLGGTADLSS